MKKLILSFSLLLLITACGGNEESSKNIEQQITELKKQKKQQEKKEKKNKKKSKLIISPFLKMQEDIERLVELEPLSVKDLKTWLPEEFKEFRRTSFKGGSMGLLNVTSIKAIWKNEDNTKTFEIELIDGAGAGATSIMAMRMAITQEIEEENEYETRRTAERDGVRVLEEYKIKDNNSTIQFMHNDRYYIKTKGLNMTLDEVWELKQEFNFDDLK